MNEISTCIRDLAEGRSLIVGSGLQVNVHLRGGQVSESHARIIRRGDQVLVQDLDSEHGTSVNGVEVRGFECLRVGDRLRLGDVEVQIECEVEAPRIVKQHDHAPRTPGVAGATIELRSATKVVSGDRRILDQVTTTLRPGEFVGILGASGSGKSTLIKSMAGLLELTSGSIAINGATLDAAALMADRRIAYLPQDVVIHESLEAAVALDYSARLKGVASDPRDRAALVGAALARVGLSDRANVPIHRLSGGQRKRIALAAELLGDPQLILLDEATSGLDPATEREMMDLFRSLAEEGRTVVCITHFPGRLALCHRLLYMMHGRCIFQGSLPALREMFEVVDIEDVYLGQHRRSVDEWDQRYRSTIAGRGKHADVAPTPDSCGTRREGESLDEERHAWVAMWLVLSERYARILCADLRNLALLIVQAPVIGLMIGLTFGQIGIRFAELHASRTKEVGFLLVLSVLWCTGTLSVREIVRESAVYHHEQRAGVSALPYLLSKCTVLGAIAMVQVLLLLLVVRFGTGLSGDLWPQMMILALTGLVGTMLGLAISAIAGTSERAMTVLPIILIGQAIFSGGMARLEGIVLFAAQCLSTAYWSLDGLRAGYSAGLRNATFPGAPGTYQPPILGAGGPLALDVLMLLVQGGALAGVAWAALRGVPAIMAGLSWIRHAALRSLGLSRSTVGD